MEQDNKIDFSIIIDKLLKNKKSLIIYALIGFVIGIVVAKSIPKEFTSTTIFTIKSNDTQLGKMSGIASFMGVNLANTSNVEVFTPNIYQDVMSSTSFIRDIWQIEVEDSVRNIKTNFFDYLDQHTKEPWWNHIAKSPFYLVNLIKGENDVETSISKSKYAISGKELKLMRKTKESFSISTNKDNAITTFKITTQSPEISAFLADTITTFLQEYIINARTQKANNNLINSKKLYLKSKDEYYKKQEELAEFIDANKNIISARHNILQEKLQNEVNLTYTIYNQMAQQLQMDEIVVQDNIPVFTIIQPPLAINKATKPKTKWVLVFFTFFATAIGLFWIIRKELITIIFK